MKICYYNWVDFDDDLKRGGGVTVYQKNLVDNDRDCFFISSGVYYKPPFKKVCFDLNLKNKRARIYNSPVLAPAHLSFGESKQLKSSELEEVFINILKKFGGVDIIHFNNLEGISCSVLERIKKEYPKSKIILSIHNYYPFCPQVNLWYRETKNCNDFNDGKKCINCVKVYHSKNTIKKAYFLSEFLRKIKINDNTFLFNKIWNFAIVINKIINKITFHSRQKYNSSYDTKIISSYFLNRRKVFIDNINENVDGVLCVSNRVKDICINFGIEEYKCHTMYIGTEHAKYFDNYDTSSSKKENDIFTIAYLGYMRADKGFPFLLSALSEIELEISKNIRLVVAAKKENTSFDKLIEIAEKFDSLVYFDGYDHNSLNDILKDVDLGIIPPLWEDNLPQVAIEMHCRKIPLLTSDTGGASELHLNNPDFTFIAGDVNSFKEHLENLFINRVDRESYFSNVLKPKSMQEHIIELRDFYYKILSEK